MKFLHLSDLHIGKRVNGFSMLEDQEYILNEILKITEAEAPDAVLIAGDVYDKPVPSAEAVALYDTFVTRLSALGPAVCIISGNHDSAERVACCGKLMERNKVYVSPVYGGPIDPVVVSDGSGEAKIWLLPFVKPVNVRAHLSDENTEIGDYTEAMQYMIDQLELNPEEINIAVAHQFISGAEICDSEEHSHSSNNVGGLDQIAAAVFAPFEYVALGHLHGPQKIGRETIRYAGSPLKYSFSELKQKKSITVVEIHSKEDIQLRTIPLIPLRELVEVRGTYEELTSQAVLKQYDKKDYFHIILTDEQDVPNAASRLREFYPNWMVLDYDNTRTRTNQEINGAINVQKRSAMDLFTELFQKQMGRELNAFQQQYLQSILEELQEERER